MIPVIGTELRRSNARILAILLVLGAVAGLASKMDWAEQWLLFSYYQTANLFVMVPLALAGGAMLGRREGRTGAAELVATTGRPRWHKIVPTAVALAVAVTAVQLLILVVGAVTNGARGHFVSFGGAIPALVDTTILIGAAWVGLAAGRAWSSPMLPPALAVLVLIAEIVLSLTNGNSRLQSLAMFPQPPNAEWESANPRAVLGHLVLGLALALGALLLMIGTSWQARTAGTATLIAGLGLTMLITPTGEHGRYQVDAAAQELVCADGTPQVCVTAVHAYQLDAVTPAARQALSMLAKLPGAPTRAVEWRANAISFGDPSQFWGTKPSIEPGTVAFELGGYGAPTPGNVTATLLNGAGTTMNGCEPGDQVASGAAGAWLMGTDSLPLRNAGYPYDDDTNNQIKATVTALRKLPGSEQVRRVTALRDAANACRTDDLLQLLTQEPTP